MRPILFLALSACSGSGEIVVDDTADTEETEDAPCVATVASIDPADDATNVSVRTDVVARFSAPVADGDFAVSIDGVTGTTTRADDGLSATFVPSTALSTETTYVAHASACSALLSATFHTAPPALPPESLAGRTYALAGSDVTLVRPAGASAFLGNLQIPWLLLHVVDVTTSPATITMSGSTGSGTTDVTQDCIDPFDVGTADFSGNPVIDVGPTTLTFPIQGVDVAVVDATVGGVFVDDGDRLTQIRIAGTLDTRQIDPISPFDVCTALQLLPNADHCAACASDGAIECLPFEIVASHADHVDDLVYDPALEPGVDCTP